MEMTSSAGSGSVCSGAGSGSGCVRQDTSMLHITANKRVRAPALFSNCLTIVSPQQFSTARIHRPVCPVVFTVSQIFRRGTVSRSFSPRPFAIVLAFSSLSGSVTFHGLWASLPRTTSLPISAAMFQNISLG